jgi:hypothetical protein
MPSAADASTTTKVTLKAAVLAKSVDGEIVGEIVDSAACVLLCGI